MLAPLGVADVDWRAQTWAVRPSTATPLPGRTNVLLLNGARQHLARYEKLDGAVLRQGAPGPSLPLPATLWLQAPTRSRLESCAEELGAAIVPCVAESLAYALREVSLGEPAQPPASRHRMKRFDPASGCFHATENAARPRDGLYEVELHHSLTRFLSVRQGKWYAADRHEAIHLELPRSAFPLTWYAQRRHAHTGPWLGRLAADYRAPLPSRHQAAAVMCTGLPPTADGSGLAYDGVPKDIAEIIARSLRRELEIR